MPILGAAVIGIIVWYLSVTGHAHQGGPPSPSIQHAPQPSPIVPPKANATKSDNTSGYATTITTIATPCSLNNTTANGYSFLNKWGSTNLTGDGQLR